MRKRARTDLCGGRSAMVVPTATIGFGAQERNRASHPHVQEVILRCLMETPFKLEMV
jgi:hypothetical protein